MSLVTPSGHGLGLHPSTPARIAHRLDVRAHPAIAARYAVGASGTGHTLPAAVLRDQGGTGKCHAHSLAAAIDTVYLTAGKHAPWGDVLITPTSSELIAACTYADVQRASVGPGQTVAPLQDTGAELQDDADAVRGWGIGPQGPQISGRSGASDSPATPANGDSPEVGAFALGQPSDLTVLQVAGGDLITGEYAIAVDANAPQKCAATIDAGFPIWVGFSVDGAFENSQPSDIIMPPVAGDVLGGHAVFLRAYRVNTNGLFEWFLRNSWGSWGERWCSTAWLLACWDLFPMTVKV